jgi:phosphatidylinositol-3-phosphatase
MVDCTQKLELVCLKALFRVALILLCLGSASMAPCQVLPRPAHVIVILESKASYTKVIGNSEAPYLNSLASQGAVFSAFFSHYRASQPNYFQLFAGDNIGVKDDSCLQQRLPNPSLGGELLQKGFTFGGYAENLPAVGSTECKFGKYARKHAPWVNFADVPANLSRPLSQLPCNFDALPTVSFVAPNVDNNMSKGSLRVADNWLKNYFDSYVRWAKSNNSLLIITWAEDGKLFGRKTNPPHNRVPMIFVGSMVRDGVESSLQYTYLDLLRTIEEMYGLSYLGQSNTANPILDVWQ